MVMVVEEWVRPFGQFTPSIPNNHVLQHWTPQRRRALSGWKSNSCPRTRTSVEPLWARRRSICCACRCVCSIWHTFSAANTTQHTRNTQPHTNHHQWRAPRVLCCHRCRSMTRAPRAHNFRSSHRCTMKTNRRRRRRFRRLLLRWRSFGRIRADLPHDKNMACKRKSSLSSRWRMFVDLCVWAGYIAINIRNVRETMLPVWYCARAAHPNSSSGNSQPQTNSAATQQDAVSFSSICGHEYSGTHAPGWPQCRSIKTINWVDVCVPQRNL